MSDRCAIVTGGAAGIGRATAGRLAADGMAVAIWDVDAERAVAEAAAITQSGGRALGCACDVRDGDAVAAALEATVETFGTPWGLVNNAGIDRFSFFKNSDPGDWRLIVDVNLVGALTVTHAVLPLLLDTGAGRIVFLSSDAARVGSMGESVYAGAKAGLLGFSKSLARECAREGITVNAVCPGPTDTALLDAVRHGPGGDKVIAAMERAVPMRRIAQPEEIAAAVAFFLGDDSAYITGQTLSVSGGLTMAG